MSNNAMDNITLDKLPQNLQALIRPNISTNEQINWCILLTDKGFILRANPQAIVITTKKLLVTRAGSQGNTAVHFPTSESWNYNLIIVEYSRIRSIKADPSGWIHIDYGLSKMSNDRVEIDPISIGFPSEWVESIMNTLNAGRIHPAKQVSQSGSLDIGDQLTKLAELRQKNMITDAEFTDAKKKLLGN